MENSAPAQYPTRVDADEIETISHVNEEKTEYTFVIKSPHALSNADVILELEYYINELSRADDQLNQPGVARH